MPLRVVALELIVAALLAVFTGKGIYRSYRKGVLTNRWGRFRRTRSSVNYWVGFAGAILVFIAFTAFTVILLVLIIRGMLPA